MIPFVAGAAKFFPFLVSSVGFVLLSSEIIATSKRGSSCINMAIALKGILSLILLLVILSSSWLIAVLLDYYTGYGKPLKPHKRTNTAPFPNGKLENIFWFVQVRT